MSGLDQIQIRLIFRCLTEYDASMLTPNMKLEIHGNKSYLCDCTVFQTGHKLARLGFLEFTSLGAFRSAISFVQGRTIRTSGQALPYL